MQRGRRRREGLDFSFTAINIILLLLFYFIVTGTISRREEYAFEAPIASDLPLTRLPRPLLAIDAAGNQLLDGRPVSAPGLAPEFAQLRGTLQGAVTLHIIAERRGPAEPLLTAARLASEAGFEVRIVTRPEDAPS